MTPISAPAPEPPPVPDVSRSVQQAANELAQRVWDGVARTRDHLLQGINPPDADRYIGHAVAKGWLMLDGELVRRGEVNPVPEPVAELPAGSSLGWDSWTVLRWGPSSF